MFWLLAAILQVDAREAARLADAGALTERTGSFWEQAAFDEIEARRTLGELWPAPKRYSFAWTDASFDEAAREIAEAIGMDIATARDDEGEWEAVTLEIKDVTPAEALSALAATGGGIPAGGAESWTISPSWTPSAAYAAWGNVGFTITGISRHQRVTFVEKPASSISLSMQVAGAPALEGSCTGRLKLTLVEAVDAKGRSLLKPPDETAAARDGDYSDSAAADDESLVGTCDAGWPTLSVDVADPGGVEKIARLRGTIELSRAGERVSTLLEKILERPEGALGDLKLSFDETGSESGQTVVTLRVTRGAAFGGTPPHLHFALRRGGEATEEYWMQAQWDGDRAVLYHFYLYGETAPDTIEVSRIETVTPFRVSFEFADVEVP